jgi:alpha-beta hydrolase superfamily lysophospholipase
MWLVSRSLTDEFAFTTADGAEVFCSRWVPDTPVRAVVLVVHGASEHAGRYARFANVLCREGFAVYAPDLRGHGRTAASTGFGRMGSTGMDGLLGDLDDVARRARADFPSRPIVVFGHSMGSLVAQAYVERYGEGLAAYVLSGSGGVPEDDAEMSALIDDALEAGMRDEPLDLLGEFNADFEPARTRYDWLSRDAEEVDKYVADPWCGDDAPLTYGFAAALVETAATVMEPDGIGRVPPRLPVLLITGEVDPVSNGAAQVRELEQRLRAAGLDVTAKYYVNGRHELLNDVNRDEVHADVVAWLGRVIPAP